MTLFLIFEYCGSFFKKDEIYIFIDDLNKKCNGYKALAYLGNELRGCGGRVVVRSMQILRLEIWKSTKSL